MDMGGGIVHSVRANEADVVGDGDWRIVSARAAEARVREYERWLQDTLALDELLVGRPEAARDVRTAAARVREARNDEVEEARRLRAAAAE